MDDFTPLFSTRDAARRYERARLRGLANLARDNRDQLRRSMLDLAAALFNLQCDGLSADALDEIARTGADAVRNRDFEFRKDIDAAGESFDPLDLSELEHFFIKREAA